MSPPKGVKVKGRPLPAKPGGLYAQVWRVVDGAIEDTFNHHQNYVTPKFRMAARISLNKRITGAVLGFAGQPARGLAKTETDTGVGDNHLTPMGRSAKAALARGVLAARAAISRWRAMA